MLREASASKWERRSRPGGVDSLDRWRQTGPKVRLQGACPAIQLRLVRGPPCLTGSMTAQRPVRTDVMGKAVPSPHTLLSRDSCLAGRAMPTERGQPLLRWVRVGRAGMSPLQWACPRDPRAGSAWTRGPPRPLPHGQEEILPWRPLAGTGGHPGQIREGAARHRHG